MSKNKIFSFDAELKVYEKLYKIHKRKAGQVKPVSEFENAIGYTTDDGTIYIKENHKTIESLNKKQKRFFRRGVFIHELSHQLFTNFNASSSHLKKLKSRREKEIFCNLDNILEDPAIERFARYYFDDYNKKALNFTIKRVYDESPELQEINGGFAQFATALIQFGDMGPIKGHFTDDVAKDCFRKCQKIFYSAIKNPSTYQRADAVKEIFEISRPLWEEMIEEEKNALSELLDKLGKSTSGNSSNSSNEGEGDSDESPIVVAIAKKINKDNESNDKPDDVKDSLRENTILIFEDDDSEENSDSKNSDNDDENGQSGMGSQKSNEENKENEDKTSEDNKGSSKNSKKDENSEDSEDSNDENNQNSKNDSVDKQPLSKEEIDEKLGEIDNKSNTTDEETSKAEQEINKAEKELQKENIEIPETTTMISDKFGRMVLTNKKPYVGNEHDYNKIVEKYKSRINSTANKFKQIFEFDKDEKIHKNTGSINLVRANGANLTSRVFDKRFFSSNHKDTSVMILVDESGSMASRNRYIHTREAVIALAEIFSKIDIPIYIIGFTADTISNGDTNHIHYIQWDKNTKKNRINLSTISARSNNRDGFSIRYATDILLKRNSEHKLMFVISDGMPLASNYSGAIGTEDTKKAVYETRKKGVSVIGVAIGEDVDTLQSIYQKDFVVVESTDKIFSAICKKLKKIFKGED